MGRGAWRKLTDTEPSNSPTTNGVASTRPVPTEDLSVNEPEFRFIDTSAMDTDSIVISGETQPSYSSVSTILKNGNMFTVWSLSPQNFIDQAANVEDDINSYPLDERQKRRLGDWAFGIGLPPALAVSDICHFLREAGFDVYSGDLKSAVDFYLDNYWYGP